jgi:predicted TIM-barrel fold metal-dependent hydrolase
MGKSFIRISRLTQSVPGIIDVHVHLSERRDDLLREYANRNGLKYTLRELLQQMAEYRVVLGLLLSPIMKGGTPLPNEDVLKICSRSEGRLAPILTVRPNPRAIEAVLGQADRNSGVVKGFKIMLGYERVFANDAVFDPLYDYAESNDLPVMYHTGDTAAATGSLVHSHPLTLDALANRRTELKIIACHFGNPWIDDVAELIYKHDNVYADVSGLAVGGSKYLEKYIDLLADRLSRAIYYAGGAGKIVFGTDYPVSTHATTLSLVAKLEIDSRDRQRILSENAREVFGL